MTTQPQFPSPPSNRNAAILDSLLRRDEPALRAQAARHAPSPDAAQDAFQDGCVEFLRYYGGPPGTDALRYLMLCVKQRAWAIGRDQRRRSCFSLAATDLSDDPAALAVPDQRPDPAALAERHAEHRAALAPLKPDQRTAPGLFAAGFSYREIAALRGWTNSYADLCVMPTSVRKPACQAEIASMRSA